MVDMGGTAKGFRGHCQGLGGTPGAGGTLEIFGGLCQGWGT